MSETATKKYDNCTQFFHDADVNENGYIGMDECIKFFARIGALGFNGTDLDRIRSNQIDCRNCLKNLTLYYL